MEQGKEQKLLTRENLINLAVLMSISLLTMSGMNISPGECTFFCVNGTS
jgi:hypothetical protein